MGPIDLLVPEPAPRFGGPPPRNAYVELHNVIAAAESTNDFGPADLDRISRRHGVDLRTAFADERRALYEAVLTARLANGDLGADDRIVLDHVARTLSLADDDLRPVHERAFGHAVTTALADDEITVEERLLLYKLQHLLGLDPDAADGAYEVLARQRLLRTVAEGLTDGTLAPDDAAAIDGVRRELGIDLPEATAAVLTAAAARWDLEHGALPTADPGLALADGETGHYVAPAEWWAVDATALAKTYPPDRLLEGRTDGIKMRRAVLADRSDTGDAVVTSRRLVLRPGVAMPDEYPFVIVVQILRFTNGILVRTKGDRRVFLDVGAEHHSAFYAVLYRALHAAAGRPPD